MIRIWRFYSVAGSAIQHRFNSIAVAAQSVYFGAMLKLGVNIDHVATLRQARYKDLEHGAAPEPNIVAAAHEVVAAGAHSITVHLREDRRHIQDRDVKLIRENVSTRLNLEMADVPEIVSFAEKLRPDEVCLVPEKRAELTTEGGLNVVGASKSLSLSVARLKRAEIKISLFIDPDLKQVRAAAALGADYVELHTGTYANARTPEAAAVELEKLQLAAQLAHDWGIRVNAGHGLNYTNTPGIFRVPHLETLNTGHSIVSRALFVGLQRAVTEMLAIMKGYPG
jgi:pyridoxine 5-phosphate synthase